MTSPAGARRCIFCHHALPSNEVVEHFPVGKRIAFDPGRGRLWAVCGSCGRWNLAPFEDRWEALEELEKARRDGGRVLASTANIALIEVPGVEVVRVGEARLAEESWWRYGASMMRRRAQYRAVKWAENAGLVAAWLATGGFFYVLGAGNVLNGLLRYRKFGRVAWRGEAACTVCGSPLEELTFRVAGQLHITRDHEGDPALHLRCRHCRSGRSNGQQGEYQIEGLPAQYVLRRVVTYHHHSGASESRVREAADYIDRLGSPAAVATELSKTGLRLDALLNRDRRTQAVALEIALNEENERRLLAMELAELEARWRQEEEIAAIVDGELTPVAGASELRRSLEPPSEP